MNGYPPDDGDRVQLTYTTAAGTVEHIGEVHNNNVIETDKGYQFRLNPDGTVMKLQVGRLGGPTQIGRDGRIEVVDG